MSLALLPRELVLLIGSFMGVTVDYENDAAPFHPNVAILPLLTKKFRWLRDYRVAVVEGGEFVMQCYYIDMMGIIDVPMYKFNHEDNSFFAYKFIRQGKTMGDYLGQTMTGIYRYYSVVNGRTYDNPDLSVYPLHRQCEYIGCLCPMCKIMITLYHRLAYLDKITHRWIASIDKSDGYCPRATYNPIRHVSTFETISQVKILSPPGLNMWDSNWKQI